jgi:hypothetical protein
MTLKLEEGITVEDMEVRESVGCVGRWREIPEDTDPRAYSDFLLGKWIRWRLVNNAHQPPAQYVNETPEELFLVRHFSEECRKRIAKSISSYA